MKENGSPFSKNYPSLRIFRLQWTLIHKYKRTCKLVNVIAWSWQHDWLWCLKYTHGLFADHTDYLLKRFHFHRLSVAICCQVDRFDVNSISICEKQRVSVKCCVWQETLKCSLVKCRGVFKKLPFMLAALCFTKRTRLNLKDGASFGENREYERVEPSKQWLMINLR